MVCNWWHTYTSVGFNVETINHQGYDFVIWDISGKDKIVSPLSVVTYTYLQL